MGKVITVASGKGGTGKTMFSVNLGATLAKQGFQVVLVDMDMGLRNLDLYFGLENNVVYDVYDVLSGLCKIKQALIRDRRFHNLYMMASSPSRNDGYLTPLHMKVLCDKLKAEYDFVIIDAPSGMDDGLTMAIAGADLAVIVVTPDYSSIRDAENIDNQFVKMGLNDRYLVINNVDHELMERGFVPGIGQITEMLRPEVIGIIQHDRNIRISTNMGVPIVMKDGTYIEEVFKNIAERIKGEN